MGVYLSCEAGVNPIRLSILAQRWHLTSDEGAPLSLVITPNRLELCKRDEPKLGAIYVNFVSSTLAYRRRMGGGFREAIARAVCSRGRELPDVVDATAGWGRDAFILGSLGCRVMMVERHPVVSALLDDGLQRGYLSTEIGSWLCDRLTLAQTTCLAALSNLKRRPDVVYLDPMYPYKQKNALVKKEMRLLQLLVGCDDDAGGLLEPARRLATQRIVVKRPYHAPPLANVAPHATIKTKNHRFDVYMPA